MPKSRFFAILSLVLLTMVLAACGSEDDPEPTAESTATEETIDPTAAEEATAEQNEDEATPAAAAASPDVSTVPDRTVATPVAGDEDAPATPVTEAAAASPDVRTVPDRTVATPVAGEDGGPATPVTEAGPGMPVDATFVFSGELQRDYLITEEGCFGLGDWSQLKPGAQVIVRDAAGTVVDVSTLAAGDEADACSWVAEISVPESEFVSVSIPMVTEIWFSQSDLESGVVKISFP